MVAAIYRDYDLAAKRAEQIAQQEKRWQPEVYPPEGQGGHRYMVLLGRAETRQEAERILARARSAGMPSDTYLTKLKPAQRLRLVMQQLQSGHRKHVVRWSFTIPVACMNA